MLICIGGLLWFASSFFLAKRSLSVHSQCGDGEHLLRHVLGLSPTEMAHLQHTILANATQNPRNGCWMDRRVDSVVILLVDALRFDFAYYNLPHSVGSRLHHNQSKLFQFVADPPTVTMQRLKALTTGGLPTFADISGNFGGASVDEDSWMRALRDIDARQRGLHSSTTRTGFVGDDTWEDLYPGYFYESFPYPSFNTRDLETVDNGCLLHLPDLIRKLRPAGDLELVVVHFLGVDHVGHTYGPHNEHMDAKLKQMDSALQAVLERLDESDECHTALIFGDHGMTEDGNHGGGTVEETNAALFVHSSPACRGLSHTEYLEHYEVSSWVEESFASIHQIDLVPTIAMQLGLPIPFANLGGLVPSLLPGHDIRQSTLALALNAAQVWRYFTEYSSKANQLPGLSELQAKLNLATQQYNEALATENDNLDLYRQASGLFKSFLNDALELGQRVWTRFDDRGMIAGCSFLLLGLIVYARSFLGTLRASVVKLSSSWEDSLSMVSMIFCCGALTFSNSYILEEENIMMFFLAVVATAVSFRLYCDPSRTKLWRYTLLVPFASRINELFISGHGLDPSIRLHLGNNALIFLSSLLVIATYRWFLFWRKILPSRAHTIVDILSLLLLGWGWVEKRTMDPNLSGYVQMKGAFALVAVGGFMSTIQAAIPIGNRAKDGVDHFGDGLTVLAKLYVAILAVTGPAAAPSMMLYLFQISMVVQLALARTDTNSLVVATLIKLATRHAYFASNHGCAFNRLQYSAAFVATKEFYFVTGGISLFLNTFGWEMVSIVLIGLLSQAPHHRNIWKIFGSWQIVEALASCVSVAILRRHLMVWDIYAPHFLFVAIFTTLILMSQLSALAINVVK